MSRLYPRLDPEHANAALKEYEGLALADLERRATTYDTNATFAATGGRTVDDTDLAELADAIAQEARSFGYPHRAGDRARTQFDRSAARRLHAVMEIAPAEAASRDVWTFFAVRLVPHVVAWRFGYDNRERWVGSDLTRHALARLWWQAYTLVEYVNGSADYHLLDVLAESELNQVFERRSIGGTPALVRAIARALASQGDLRLGDRRDLVRDVLKRLRRLVPFTSFLALPTDVLQARIDAVVEESLLALQPPTPAPAMPQPGKETWHEVTKWSRRLLGAQRGRPREHEGQQG